MARTSSVGNAKEEGSEASSPLGPNASLALRLRRLRGRTSPSREASATATLTWLTALPMMTTNLATLQPRASPAPQVRDNAAMRAVAHLVAEKTCWERSPALDRRASCLRKRLGVANAVLLGEAPTRRIRCTVLTGLAHRDPLPGACIVECVCWIAMGQFLLHGMMNGIDSGRRGVAALLSRRISG